MKLSILTVTRFEAYTPRFLTHFRALADICGAEFVVAYDRCDRVECGADVYVPVTSGGVIEDVLVEAHAACSGDYVLRMDDDETLSAQAIMDIVEWGVEDADSRAYAFPRANLWGDEWHAVRSGDLFPDFQVRLMPRFREMRKTVHEGMMPDALMPGMILHHKFLLKSREERERIAAVYESRRAGSGSGHYLQFSVPEACFGIETFAFRVGRVSA